MPQIKTVAVFAGSSAGNDPHYAEVMQACGARLARMDKEVWCGGLSGMMNAIAQGVLENGGHVKVFQPPHNIKTELVDVFQRARKNGQLEICPLKTDNDRNIELLKADAWLSGPGSAGTIGETVRGITWNVDRTYRSRPITPHFILNIDGQYENLSALYALAVQRGFGTPDTMGLFQMVEDDSGLERALFAAEQQGPIILDRVSYVNPEQS